MDHNEGIAELFRHLCDFETGVCRVAATVVKEIPDMVCLEDRQQPVILHTAFREAFQLVARGTERTRRSVLEPRDGGGRFLTGVDELFGQGTDDAMAAGVYLTNLFLMLACGLN